MIPSPDTELIQARIFHTPFHSPLESVRLAAIENGGLVIEGGRIAFCGDYLSARRQYPSAPVRDWREGCVIPGLIDTHVHYPQLRVIGTFGYSLLEWLARFTLPEEARFADNDYAQQKAFAFVHALAAHGTTTALAFGSHYCAATRSLFEAAEQAGIRLYSGLVVSDRHLLPELHTTPEKAYLENKKLIDFIRGKPRLGYVVTPRFALSASERMLAVCQTLLAEEPQARFTTHMNENREEVSAVGQLFSGSKDYLDVYERWNLVSRRAVLAHNVHATEGELSRIAAHGASVSQCPCSNAALGSGIFPLRRHMEHGVRVSLGSDVGGGTGFGLLKEGLQAYLLQRLAPEPVTLNGAQLLHLATRAGAEALGIADETGDFTPGKSADLVYVRPSEGSVLQRVLDEVESAEHALTAIFSLAGSESVREVRVGGNLIYGERIQ